MSSSSESRRAGVIAAADLPALPELRVGTWTRLGASNVLGDQVTESLLDGIAAEARDAARAQGYAVGWAEGRRAAELRAAAEDAERAHRVAQDDLRREAEHRAALAALAEAAAEVRTLADAYADALAEQAADLVLAMTTEIVGARLAAVTPADTIARVVAVLPEAAVGRVHLHPSLVDDDAVAVLRERGLEILTDAGLERHDAIVETADGAVVDLRVGAAMKRLREVLG
ncbi:FliH/SctL family protein [Nocardioides sp.]|uniref:FliH/SctL family protein n=1 Tax=Nocardioides sp. TaxID=35761 RepID=UPI0035192EA2